MDYDTDSETSVNEFENELYEPIVNIILIKTKKFGVYCIDK